MGGDAYLLPVVEKEIVAVFKLEEALFARRVDLLSISQIK
jgi:hypothetical protein